jgi:hypothetical protein
MRSRKMLVGLLLVTAGVGAAVLVLRSGPSRLVEVIRDQSLDADNRMLTIRLKSPSSCRVNRFQARLRKQWTEPRDVFGPGFENEVVCVVPAGADACRLMLRVDGSSMFERASEFFYNCGLARRMPVLCDWVVSHLSHKRSAAKDLTIEIALPGAAPNKRVESMRSSAVPFLPKAGAVDAVLPMAHPPPQASFAHHEISPSFICWSRSNTAIGL